MPPGQKTTTPDVKKAAAMSTGKSTATPQVAQPGIAPNRTAITMQAQQTLDLLHQRLTDVEARVTNNANAFLAQAQSQPLQAMAQSSPDLRNQLPTLIASLQKAATMTQASQNTRSQALSNVRAKLQSLMQSKT